ncbi:MAG: cupin domain-containing protein [Glycocaulis sp.]|nr:cupin domain-containing protein [Glycocaulis sp.]MCH8521519.1 cupin domain-containing protein [Glycocaulis sp.]
MRAVSGDMEAVEIIRLLGMEKHPEGGWYVETFRDALNGEGRAHSTAIYFLLAADEVSAWHRVDASEIWLWHAGAPLALTVSPDGVEASAARLGPDLRAGQRPQAVIPAGAWQTAESLGGWTLVSCVVAPGFEFSGFELAAPHWRPGPHNQG